MKLCVFQGTFNPIHKAHLRVAQDVISHYDFDKIIFIPAYNPPHKSADLDFSKHRLKMVQLAVKINPRFETSDIEFKREGKSYTILTIKELYSLYEVEGKIHFIIGTDAFEKIETWYEIDKLKNMLNFLVFYREDNFNPKKFDNLKQKGFIFEMMKMPFTDISSTEIRKKIKNNEDFSTLVDKNVVEYIYEHEIFK